jgi:amino acid adenylation domain-containing protein
MTNTIHGLFEKHAREKPDDIAVVFGEQSFTYGALNQQADKLAHYLRTQGVQADCLVAIVMPRSFELFIAILGVLKAGGAYVPLDSTQPEERLLFVLNDNGSPCLIITNDLQQKFSQYQGVVMTLDDVMPVSDYPAAQVMPDNLAYIIYTSGSTGIPKGVLIQHNSVVHFCRWFAGFCEFQPQARVDFSSNHSFDMAVANTIVPLMLGLTVVIAGEEVKKDLRHYLEYLHHQQVHVIKITPSYFKVLLQEVTYQYIPLPHLTTIVLGGENLSTADCAAWLSLYPQHQIFNEYGPTEATVAVTHYKVTLSALQSLGSSVPMGRPNPEVTCYLYDSENKPVADGEIGELHLGGLCLARGYLNQKALTQAKFIQDPVSGMRVYKTGDLCRRLPNDMLEYIGRVDSQVKIRGFRVELSEIEKQLQMHPAIKTVVVLARPDQFGEKRIFAYYEFQESDVSEAVNFSQYLQQTLPDYMIPSAFIRVDSFPLTANGKLNHAALPAPQWATSQHYRAPSSELEKQLVAIWADVLGIKTIGVDDDFFELGGHSLSAARIVSMINHVLKKNVSVHAFYISPTIAKLARYLENISSTEQSAICLAPSMQDSNVIPLSDFQFMLWLSNTFEPKAKKINMTARKRVDGRLDVTALTAAFDAIIKKHEILSYRIFTFRPKQSLTQPQPFILSVTDLADLAEDAVENTLNQSMQLLMDDYPWERHSNLIVAKLFYLNDGASELQISMPHIIADDIAPEVIFAELSQYYLHYLNQTTVETITANMQYRTYIAKEQDYFNAHLDRDRRFWEAYLREGELFTFPPEHVVRTTTSTAFTYSTFCDIPEDGLTQLQRFCAQQRISLIDGLCAAIIRAIEHCSKRMSSQPIVINLIKSTRHEAAYEHAVGCFLSVDPIKVDSKSHSAFASLSKQIHQSIIETAPYQQCSNLIKIASIHLFRKAKPFKIKALSILTTIYTTLFRMPAHNRSILKYSQRLAAFKRSDQFMININVNRDFATKSTQCPTAQLFGYKTKAIPKPQHDLLAIDSIFEVFFKRHPHSNTPYLVISANLTPDFRDQIAKTFIKIIETEAAVNFS